MSLKSFVNDKLAWDAFLEEMDDMIRVEHTKIEVSTDLVDLYRSQGAITVLRRLKYLRDKINGTK